MSTNKQQNRVYKNISNDIEHTDDEDEEEEEEDSYDERDNYNYESLRNSSPNVSLGYSSSYNSSNTSQTRKRSPRSQSVSHSFNTTEDSYSKPIQFVYVKRSSTKEEKSNLFLYVLIIFLMLLVVIFGVALNETEIPKKTITKKSNLEDVDKTLHKEMKNIEAHFKNQKDNIWNEISSGIYDVVLFPEKPKTIILFGNEPDTLNYLAEMLGQLSGYILGSNDYLMLTPKDFPNDIGHVISSLKNQIVRKKAVIVKDLLQINTDAIRAFHNFCDRENPLVGHAVYIITINVDGYKPYQGELQFIEKHIFKSLSNSIDKDILDPLVTRLTDGVVVPVMPEPDEIKEKWFSVRYKI